MVTLKVTPKLEPVVEQASDRSQSMGFDTPASDDENQYMEVDDNAPLRTVTTLDKVKADLEEAMRDDREIDAPSGDHNATSVASPRPDHTEASPSPDSTMDDESHQLQEGWAHGAEIFIDDETVDDTQLAF